MADRETVLSDTWLFFGAAASLLTSLFGCVGILGALWMQGSAKDLFPYVLLVLVVPLFALAMTLSKRFIIGLWTIALVYPSALILIEGDLYTTKPDLFFVVGTIASLLIASLSHFSARSNAILRNRKRGDTNALNG